MYASSIGIARVLVMVALLIFPELMQDIVEITKVVCAKSTLTGINIDAKCERLDRLMVQDKVYQYENLSLNGFAEMLELTSHQLSELINTRYGCGFPRFVRQQRVAAAKQMLIDEPSATVLSFGTATGFKSQSSFYAAFQEIAGMSPGKYRKSVANA